MWLAARYKWRELAQQHSKNFMSEFKGLDFWTIFMWEDDYFLCDRFFWEYFGYLDEVAYLRLRLLDTLTKWVSVFFDLIVYVNQAKIV